MYHSHAHVSTCTHQLSCSLVRGFEHAIVSVVTISTLAANLEVCIIDLRGYLFKDKQAETTSQKMCLLESQGNFGVLEASCLSKDAQICSLKVDKKRLEVSLF